MALPPIPSVLAGFLVSINPLPTITEAGLDSVQMDISISLPAMAALHTIPQSNAQDITENWLGKMLRIDVDGDDFPADANRNYAIPASNPFVGVAGDDEIWAYGLRNPWRSSFDRQTGDLYIADVGQGDWEEINVQPAGSAGGENYGWRLREGLVATPSIGGDKPEGAIDPIHVYQHGSGPDQGLSVSGGYVYRGPIQECRATISSPIMFGLEFGLCGSTAIRQRILMERISWTIRGG